ncbi:RNA methyltransferase [Planktosalinus lacus]|uniref:RNA methyltransferase n=1 Tax=Planktosalinus lacus TaxID=1526573 RepID=A0A8J2V8L6_9FLAO|nr:RNA methyltransferase [Planktosalinus lacus]GGD88999.1 RNA methyltransferase [Planktosalinus lacus]
MVSKSQIKLITSLQQKKFRIKHQLFFVEGTKVIQEFYQAGWKLHSLFATSLISGLPESKTTEVSPTDLKKISVLKSPNTALAVFEISASKSYSNKGIQVALNDVRDPGNLGTIIRLCDWFGVQQLICSSDTVDCYNPKVLQASMGSLARVNVVYKELDAFFTNENSLPVYGAFMDGQSVYEEQLPSDAIILMGNEGKGISVELEPFLTKKISIPQFGNSKETESLNVAMATSILLSEFHRSIGK